jgi:hypothetical protein
MTLNYWNELEVAPNSSRVCLLFASQKCYGWPNCSAWSAFRFSEKCRHEVCWSNVSTRYIIDTQTTPNRDIPIGTKFKRKIYLVLATQDIFKLKDNGDVSDCDDYIKVASKGDFLVLQKVVGILQADGLPGGIHGSFDIGITSIREKLYDPIGVLSLGFKKDESKYSKKDNMGTITIGGGTFTRGARIDLSLPPEVITALKKDAAIYHTKQIALYGGLIVAVILIVVLGKKYLIK